ncbi:MAG: signal peptidase II [Anaerolineales bacterium]|nr:signal peptidase II [Anaerolineales bacterium]
MASTPQSQPVINLRSYLSLVLVSGAIILLDQLTKAWVRDNLALSQTWMPWEQLAPYARIVHWQNSGAAFGMFQNAGAFFAVLAILVAGMIIYYFPRLEPGDWAVRLGMSLQLGGALGNLIDRLQHGHVTDFISIGNFPIWNIADAAITCGVAVMILDMLFNPTHKKPAATAPVHNDDQTSS